MEKIQYFFEETDDFPIAGFLDGLLYPYEILIKAKEYFKSNKSFIHPGASVDDTAVIRENVYIDDGAEVGSHAIIRPNTIICKKASVGHGSEVKHSVLFPGSKVASLSFVGDSVIGRSARIGSGVITANRKFDQSVVTLKCGEDRESLGDDFFGLVLGDFSRIGANSVTQPGCHIGRYSWVMPGTVVRGFVPSEKRVYDRRETVVEDSERVELK
ncbi:MAG: hypothetical protein LBQ91_00455 [Oscillospiraceae bacterium]|jgi:bifunctional UDP-N-acetylglucosamine pyrophosphorylase/glucosamine-1-phosphate N-acetyltransferase|nr:hypothetical protein [Oscillospiraceae bacterium]